MEPHTAPSFHSLLNSNYAALPHEVGEIQAIIDNHRSIVDNIHCQVKAREEELRVLQEDLQRQNLILEQHRGLLAPARRIPTDILPTIFQAVVEHEAHNPPPKMSRNHPAVILSHVCCVWRQVALTLPMIWASIVVTIPDFIPSGDNPTSRRLKRRSWLPRWMVRLSIEADIARSWILRTLQSPLSITMTHDDRRIQTTRSPNTVAVFAELAQFLDIFLQTVSRWKEVDFNCNFTFRDSPIWRLFAVPPHGLERVNVSLRAEDGLARRIGSPQLTLLQASSLSSLTISKLTQDIDKLSVNWASLTHLSFDGPVEPRHMGFSGDQALRLLKACPNLISCCLTLINGPDIPVEEPTTLHALQKLTLFSNTVTLTNGLASSLILPSLNELRVIPGPDCSTRHEEVNGFVDFIIRFGSTLTHLTFYYQNLGPSALHSCLARLPHLRHLTLLHHSLFMEHLWVSEPRSALVDALNPLTVPVPGNAPVSPADVCCPMLVDLRFTVDRHNPETTCSGEVRIDALVDFIASRRRKRNRIPGYGNEVDRVTELESVHVGTLNSGWDTGEVDLDQEVVTSKLSERTGVDVATLAFQMTYLAKEGWVEWVLSP